MAEQEHLPVPFTGHHTSLDDLNAAGWETNGNGYSWWWQRAGDRRQRLAVPYWIRQLVYEAEKRGYDRGKTDVRAAFREAFGVAGPRVKVKDTPEFPVGENEEPPDA